MKVLAYTVTCEGLADIDKDFGEMIDEGTYRWKQFLTKKLAGTVFNFSIFYNQPCKWSAMFFRITGL